MRSLCLVLLTALTLSAWLVVDHWQAPQGVKEKHAAGGLKKDKTTRPALPELEPSELREVALAGRGSPEREEPGASIKGNTSGSSNERSTIGWPKDPEWLEQMAESLRRNGLDEADVQAFSESMTVSENETDYSDEPPVGEMSSEQMEEEVRTSLLEAGLPPDEVDMMVEDIVAQLQGKSEKPRPSVPTSP